VEIKRDARSGQYFILEPNIGRPTGRSAIAEAGGVDLLYTMYCDALGWSLPQNVQQTYSDVKWIYLRRDLQSAMFHWQEGDLTLKEWWQSVRGRKTYALFSWNDPGPFFGDLHRAVRLYLQPAERRKRNYRDL
jgi:predicted ATP-grasp superfamily ATP-dependent carboligase